MKIVYFIKEKVALSKCSLRVSLLDLYNIPSGTRPLQCLSGSVLTEPDGLDQHKLDKKHCCWVIPDVDKSMKAFKVLKIVYHPSRYMKDNVLDTPRFKSKLQCFYIYRESVAFL